MTKLTIIIVFLLAALDACNGQKSENKSTQNTVEINMNTDNFKKIVNTIKTTDVFGKPENWEARGLNPSDQSVIQILRGATNSFLDNLEKIYTSKEPSETKLKQISSLVDELPWDKLDTEEKEFLADTLAPAIEAAGFNPWKIF